MLNLIILLPIFGVLYDIVSKNYIKKLLFLISICEFYLSILLFIRFNNNNIEIKERIFYIVDIGIDALNLPLILLTTIIMPIVLLIREIYNNEDNKFQRYIIIIEICLILVFVVNDIIFFYTMFELLLIPMFLIIIIYGSRFKKYEAAYKFIIYTILGSLFFLIGILILYLLNNSTNNSILEFKLSIINSKGLNLLLFLLFFLSFAIKIPMYPFHIWLPMAHTEAPATGSVILAAILLKLGIFGFLKYSINILGISINSYMSPIVITIALISIIYSTFVIFKLIDIKKIIAYSSIVHMNFMMIGIYIFDIKGLIGSYYSVISHGIISSGLFILIGVLYRRYHSRVLLYYKGIATYIPIFSAIWLIFIISNISFPLTSAFPGELLIVYGIYTRNYIYMYNNFINNCIIY